MTRCCLAMPRPVEALPCGSMSIRSTRLCTAASAVARLTAVVVLPTPPFWLTTAKIRGGLAIAAARPVVSRVPLTDDRLQFDDDAGGGAEARELAHLHVPGFLRCGQFIRQTGTFEEIASGTGLEETVAPLEEICQAGEASGCDDVDGEHGHGLDAKGMDRHSRVSETGSLLQKVCLARVRLDEMNHRHAQDGEDQPGQPGSASEIDQTLCAGRQEPVKLGGIQDVPAPDIGEARCGDEIDLRGPFGQEVGIAAQAVQCFT